MKWNTIPNTLQNVMISTFITCSLVTPLCLAAEKTPSALPPSVQSIITKPAYEHSLWAFYVKDLTTDKVLYQYNQQQMVSPASNTKLFTVSALLDTYGLDYRFKTPVYADGEIKNGTLKGDLILVAKGDLTMGGRRTKDGHIAFTNFDHVDANEVPGAILTPQAPLAGLKQLAQQVKTAGITNINGQVLVDDRYFETITKRVNVISPIIINDNLYDFTVTPTSTGQPAKLQWRPKVPQVTVINQVKTVPAKQAKGLEISANEDESVITVSGSIGQDQTNIVNVYPIKNPKQFAQDALQQALIEAGITIHPSSNNTLPDPAKYKTMQPVATLTSAPLIDYARLILKVSHNVGANLVPLLLAAKHGKTTYDEGMIYLGDYLKQQVKIPANQFVIAEAAGADKNRINPPAAVSLLDYWYQKPKPEFQQFVSTLPILGVDGSLATVEKDSPAKGHVFAKTGTNMVFDLANNSLYLTTKALAGYIKAPNNHWLAFMFAANNVSSPTINDLFQVLADNGAITTALYESGDEKATDSEQQH